MGSKSNFLLIAKRLSMTLLFIEYTLPTLVGYHLYFGYLFITKAISNLAIEL